MDVAGAVFGVNEYLYLLPVDPVRGDAAGLSKGSGDCEKEEKGKTQE